MKIASVVLLSFAGFACSGEIVSLRDSSACFSLDLKYWEPCAAAIRSGTPYAFELLESSSTRMVIRPISPTSADSGTIGVSERTNARQPVEQDREQTSALKRIADAQEESLAIQRGWAIAAAIGLAVSLLVLLASR
jgi:hypothetical protein